MATTKKMPTKPAAAEKKKKTVAPKKPARVKKGREYAARGSADVRSERLQMRLRADEKKLFERAAARAGDLDAASWARRNLLAAARAELGEA